MKTKIHRITKNEHTSEASPWRMALPQILASCAKNLLLFDLGMALGFATIVIPALSGIQSDRYPNETLYFTPQLASWFGSLLFLTQPIGSLLSGWFTELIGRKWAMIGCTVPHIVAWIVFWCSNTIVQVFAAGVLLGFGVGLMETSVVAYVSEISHPSIRGMLLLFSYISVVLGTLTIYILGAVTTWRVSAMIALVVPVFTGFALIFVPESPYWLLSQKRQAEAMVSLQWLRGWVSPAAVQTEFNEISSYIKVANSCDACRLAKPSRNCDHDSSYLEKCSDLLRPKFLKPFLMLSVCFVIIQFSGSCAIRPFLVQIMVTMRLPLDANWASVIMSAADISSNLICMAAMTVHYVGKRSMFLVAMIGCMISTFGLSLNAYLTIPLDISSFNQTHSVQDIVANNYSALFLFLALAFFSNMAMTVPWMMISEIFPFRVRGTACGIGAAFCYFTIFVATKSYFNVENVFGIAGTFLLYGILCILGCVFQHFMLPETDGYTLEDIEVFYSKPGFQFFDRNIKHTNHGNNLEKMSDSNGYDNEAFTKL